MDFFRKVKSRELPPETILWIVLAPLLLIVIFLFGFGFLLLVPVVLVISVIWGLRATWGALALIEFLLALLQAAFYLRTKNPAFLWMMAAFLLILLFSLQVSVFGLTKKDPLFIPFALGIIFAIPCIENVKIIFSLTSSYWKQIGLKRGYSDESWISIDDAGKVTTFISKSDYLKYRDVFSFDQLYINLGNLFIDFFELTKQGDGFRIIDRLKSMKLNPLTE
jgi:hypothetical protein